jgi:methylated-DNA-protein-cysteine methyltransferase-like protein
MNRAEFYEQVYSLVRLIPKGRVTTYGAIARSLGHPGGARMVGYAMNLSHRLENKIPAHRVVNRIGLLTGKHHFDAPGKMEELLASEGIEVIQDKVSNFEVLFWNPIEEIDVAYEY